MEHKQKSHSHKSRSQSKKSCLWVLNLNIICFLTEEAAADEKRGKLYKPKSRFENQTKSILPLETPPQFLALDKRHVSTFILNKWCLL